MSTGRNSSTPIITQAPGSSIGLMSEAQCRAVGRQLENARIAEIQGRALDKLTPDDKRALGLEALEKLTLEERMAIGLLSYTSGY